MYNIRLSFDACQIVVSTQDNKHIVIEYSIQHRDKKTYILCNTMLLALSQNISVALTGLFKINSIHGNFTECCSFRNEKIRNCYNKYMYTCMLV